ncbi:hypothetical protein RsoM2USA_464 [Ralstonia phage RsoM2USA]|nr:hypothetical protein RsoM2USA_464 [Ralstonia phage RsoM2USA]
MEVVPIKPRGLIMLKQMKELLALREADDSLDLDGLDLDTGLDDLDPGAKGDGGDDKTDKDDKDDKGDKKKDHKKDDKDGKKEKPETVVLTKDALEVLLDLQRDGTEVDAEALLDAMLEQGYLDGDQVRDLVNQGEGSDDDLDADGKKKKHPHHKKHDDDDADKKDKDDKKEPKAPSVDDDDLDLKDI